MFAPTRARQRGSHGCSHEQRLHDAVLDIWLRTVSCLAREIELAGF